MEVNPIIKVGLVILLIASCGKLIYTHTEWYPHQAYLSDVENMMASELKGKIEFLNHQSKYLHSNKNWHSLEIWYCEEKSCIDSLRRQFLDKNKWFQQDIEKIDNYLIIHGKGRWEKLKNLFRMGAYLEFYRSVVWAYGCNFAGPPVVETFNYLTDSIQVAQFELDDRKNNDLISINSGPFQRDTSQGFKTPYQDTLRLTYFKDNYSYAMGGDSILKEYVIDVSHFKEK